MGSSRLCKSGVACREVQEPGGHFNYTPRRMYLKTAMPTTITQRTATRRKYPPNPERDGLLSLDPADWWMYCDRLQDAGAPAARWRWAKRVGDSLHAEPRLLLFALDATYYPRVVIQPDLRVFNPETGKMMAGLPYPAWVKPAHVHLLRWDRARIPSGITPGDHWLNDAFTPDHLTPHRCTLALYRYACDFGTGTVTGRYGEAIARAEFIACHGRLSVEADLDARKEWYK